eukprot:sb/3472282/
MSSEDEPLGRVTSHRRTYIFQLSKPIVIQRPCEGCRASYSGETDHFYPWGWRGYHWASGRVMIDEMNGAGPELLARCGTALRGCFDILPVTSQINLFKVVLKSLKRDPSIGTETNMETDPLICDRYDRPSSATFFPCPGGCPSGIHPDDRFSTCAKKIIKGLEISDLK